MGYMRIAGQNSLIPTFVLLCFTLFYEYIYKVGRSRNYNPEPFFTNEMRMGRAWLLSAKVSV